MKEQYDVNESLLKEIEKNKDYIRELSEEISDLNANIQELKNICSLLYKKYNMEHSEILNRKEKIDMKENDAIIKAYKAIIPKYIKDKQIQHNRFFTCCDDIAIAIQKRKMEGK